MNSYIAKIDYYRELLEDSLRESLPVEKVSEKVLKAMRYCLLGGGKRIRGIFTLACFELFSDRIELVLPAAVAIEMVHAYSLIHDDLPCMDDDEMRRGKPSCHIAFGEAVAMLAGDALLSEAFSVLSDITNSSDAIRCVKILGDAAGFRGMIRGQELDIALCQKRTIKKDELNKIYSLKTGNLYTAAASMGAIIAGSSEEDLATVVEVMQKIGLVFQILDDLIDIEEDIVTEVTDGNKDKISYLSLYDQNSCRKIAEKLTQEAIEMIESRFKSKAWFISQLASNLLVRTK